MVSAVLILACQNPRPIALRAIEEFRRLQAAGGYSQIYDASGERFRQAIARDQFEAFMTDLRARLGRYRGGKIGQPQWLLADDGNVVTVEMEAVYERGEATEGFIYFVKGQRAQLLGYRIDSPLLAKTPALALLPIRSAATHEIKKATIAPTAILARTLSFTTKDAGEATRWPGNYTYDVTGNVLSIGGTAQLFDYDARSRLTKADYGAPEKNFGYDRFGNIDLDGIETSYVTDPTTNRVTTWGGQAVTHDLRGNLTQVGTSRLLDIGGRSLVARRWRWVFH